MIITDLDHLECATNNNQVKGGLADAQIEFEALALGTVVSQTTGKVETLATSSPGQNISGLQGGFSATASSGEVAL